MNPGSEKEYHPPAYTEIYPNVVDPAMQNMGWQPAQVPLMTQPSYGTQQQQPAQAVTVIMQNQSHVGLYPIQLSPCPHCQRECKTTIKYENTIRTHLSGLLLCLMCCCCCVPLPYMTQNCTKNASHFCENCKNYIGSYDRNPFKW